MLAVFRPRKNEVVEGVSRESLEAMIYGMISGMISEKLREVVEMQSAIRSEVLTKIKDIDKGFDQLKTEILTQAKTEVIGKVAVIDSDAIADLSKKTSKELRALIVKSAKKIARMRGIRYPFAYGVIYDYAAPIIGFHPYDIGKETKGSGGASYIRTVENRGKLTELTAIAVDLARK